MNTIDRAIRLDVSVPDFASRMDTPTHTGGNNSPPRRPADNAAQEQFNEALASKPSPQNDTPQQQLPTPLSLFGSLRLLSSEASADARPALDAALSQALLQRLMVDDGGSNQTGGKQVRIELKDDVLPGVSVLIQEAGGRLQVDFICSVETSRLRLNEAAPAQAQILAERLSRPVLLTVQTNDPDDLCLLEVMGIA